MLRSCIRQLSLRAACSSTIHQWWVLLSAVAIRCHEGISGIVASASAKRVCRRRRDMTRMRVRGAAITYPKHAFGGLPNMKHVSKPAAVGAAMALCVLAAPLTSTSAAAAPAASAVDMMRAIQSTTASPVEQVHRRGWRRHHRHCRVVRRCWRGGWGHHRRCRWVRRCGW